MPEFVFGVGLAKPVIAFHAANRRRKSAGFAAGRNSLARTLAVWALMVGFVHRSGTPVGDSTPLGWYSKLRAAAKLS
jgi:hypothetical protein